MNKYFSLIFSTYLSVFVFLTALSPQTAYAGRPAQQPASGRHEVKHPNGKVMEKGYFRNGQKHGTWLFYDDKGMMTKKEKWKAGELQWQMYFEKGRVSRMIDKKGRVTERPACGC